MSIGDSPNSAKHHRTKKATCAQRHKSEHLNKIRSKNTRQNVLLQKMGPKNASASKEALSLAYGNRRKSNRTRLTPSQKEKENITKQQDGIVVLSDESADELVDAMDATEDVAEEGVPQWFKKHLQQYEELVQMIAHLVQQNNEIAQQKNDIKQQNEDIKQGLARSQQRVEELEIQAHRAQEERSSGQSYADVTARGVVPASGPSISLSAPRAEELFCTIDYSRIEGGEEVADAVNVRKKIEEEVQKGGDKAFKCRGVIRDGRAKQRLRILCRSEAELDIVKRAATATVVEGARILKDQLYPVKVNKTRTDAILLPSGEVREEAIAALSDSNNTKVAKLSWLSSRQARKAYGSMVIFFTIGSEAERFLRDGFFTVGRRISVHSNIRTEYWAPAVLQLSKIKTQSVWL